MSLSEERRMVLEMLSEGKIEVEDAQGLLDALEESRPRPVSAGLDDRCCTDLGDLTIELDQELDFLDEAPKGLGDDLTGFASRVA